MHFLCKPQNQEFKSDDDRTRFKFMMELWLRFHSAVGRTWILTAVLEVFCSCFLIESL